MLNPKTHQQGIIDEDEFEVPECDPDSDEASWDYYYPPQDANGGWREINVPIMEGLA